MKIDKNKLLSMDTIDERIGSALSRELSRTEVGHCPEHEEIAAVVEGTVTFEERDRVLRHISGCNTCYEIFLLTSELHKEEESKKEKYKILRLKHLALAASILILIFSVYVFYRSDEIPKTSPELFEDSSALKKSHVEPRQPKDAPLESVTVKRKGYTVEKIEKEPRKENLKSLGALKTTPEPKKEIVRDRLTEKKEEKTGEEVEIEREKSVGDMRFKGVPKTGIIRKKKPERRSKMKVASRINEATRIAVSQRQVAGKVVPVQSQAVQLNQMVQRFDSYISQKELGSLFEETIELSQQLWKEFKTYREEAINSGNLNEVDAYVNGLRPLLNVKVIDDNAYVSPNIDWFFSRSAPESIEHQFFSLARSGWCDSSGLCYKEGKVNGIKVKSILVQWQTLFPQLSGIFKKVATQTITHLDQKKGK